jgi:oxygen-dependent protoporphyrinogen oxidase
MTLRIAVVGAGISGLSTHWFLEREARRQGLDVQVETWDPKPQPGGNIRTESRDGWRCEEAAESILNSRSETRELALELGLGERIVQASPLARKRFLLWKGRLRAMGPGSVFGGFPTWPAKLAALKEPLVGRGPEDESVADFGRRRLGTGLFEQVMDPMVTGIYAASPERLSVRSAFPRIKNMEALHGSLFRGMLAARKARSGVPADRRPGSGSYSFLGGMTDLVQALSSGISGPLRRGEPVRSMERSGSLWILRGRERSGKFDHVVLAVPSHQLSGIEGLPVEIRQDLTSVPYNPVAVVGLGFRRDRVAHPLDGFGFLVPRSENRRILGTLFSSSLWPHAAPEGHVLVRSMVGGGRQPELAGLSASALTDMVRSELADILGAEGEPEFVHVRAYAQGIPEYPVGHHDTIRRLRARMEGSGLHIAGNAWDGIGLNDCVAAALPRARALLVG